MGLNVLGLPLYSLFHPIYGSGFMYLLICGVSALFISGASALLLLPTLLLAPRRSPWVRWPVLSLFGGVAGAAIIVVYYWLSDQTPSTRSVLFCVKVGWFTGALTGTCAALLVRRLCSERSA